MPGNGHFFVLTKSGAAAKMLGDVVSAYRMPIAGAHQPNFFSFGVQRKPYTNERAKRASLVIVYLIVKLDIVVRNEEVSWFLVKTLRKKYPCETLRVLVKDM